jgi:putative Mg2+ transporter-C (MgtC) family protein
MKTALVHFMATEGKVLTHIGESPDWGFSPDFLFKIGLALVAGLLIGIEREYKGKDAGLKTNMLVSIGACAFVILSLRFQGGDYIDLTRVLSQVIIGVGFLGGRHLKKERFHRRPYDRGHGVVQCGRGMYCRHVSHYRSTVVHRISGCH